MKLATQAIYLKKIFSLIAVEDLALKQSRAVAWKEPIYQVILQKVRQLIWEWYFVDYELTRPNKFDTQEWEKCRCKSDTRDLFRDFSFKVIL